MEVLSILISWTEIPCTTSMDGRDLWTQHTGHVTCSSSILWDDYGIWSDIVVRLLAVQTINSLKLVYLSPLPMDFHELTFMSSLPQTCCTNSSRACSNIISLHGGWLFIWDPWRGSSLRDHRRHWPLVSSFNFNQPLFYQALTGYPISQQFLLTQAFADSQMVILSCIPFT